jgi:2-C-methyl-D-erythritol 4-phosphate cytidylyltransferase
MNIDLILVGAGEGSRFGSDTPKQFVDLIGSPVFVHSVSAFLRSFQINKVILVVSKNWFSFVNEEMKRHFPDATWTLAEGGRTRKDSVLSGLMHSFSEYVAIHDAARPLISEESIKRVFEKAYLDKASILAVPANETIKICKDGLIHTTPKRDELWFARTPQVFERELILKA